MRNMSFMKTIDQIRDQSKTVTRRFGWKFLKPGDVLCAIEKGQGLKKGEKVVRLGRIEVVSVRRERVLDITDDDVVREGFPDMSRHNFMYNVLLKGAKVKHADGAMRAAEPWNLCTRIEFKYIEGGE